MNWQEPELVEINMSAEIGAYQEDFEEREDRPAFASAAAPQLATSKCGSRARGRASTPDQT